MQFLKNLLGLAKRKKLKRPEFAYLFDKAPLDEWVSLDLEMTGLNPKNDHILSVGAVKIIRKDSIITIDTANALSIICKPPVMPTTESIIIHGLRPIDVEHGVDYQSMIEQLLSFIENRTLLGFCIDMDINFLNAHIKPFLGINLPNNRLDISYFEQQQRQKAIKNPDIITEQKHLNLLLKDYSIPQLPAHDALNDALMAALLFSHLQNPPHSLKQGGS